MLAHPTADALRSAQDRELFKQLLKHQDVARLNKRIAKREAEGPMGTRRHLLATSVRLSATMAPSIHKTADECIERLGIDIPVELYVYSSPSFNAACVKPEEGRLFIMFSSSLLEGFYGSEFRFVMGHELGHYIYQHHNIPIGYLMGGKHPPEPRLALQLSTWSRYAEISADRAGAHCSQDLQGVARALFKLASGLTGSIVEFDFNDFLAQVDDMQLEQSESTDKSRSHADWFMTHPFSPLRVKALKLFDGSELAQKGGMPLVQLESEVQELMGLMEPSYLEGKTPAAESMRRLLYAASLAIADANGDISAQEIAVFEKFFGPHSYNDNLNISKLTEELPKRIEQVKKLTAIGQRAQLIRDLGLIVCASGNEMIKEIALLEHIAQQLDVSEALVTQALCQPKDLD